MVEFKIGDLVTGNENCHYGITDEHSVCKVIALGAKEYTGKLYEVPKSEGEDILVELLEGRDQSYIGYKYWLDSERMKIYTKVEVLIEW